MRAVSKIEKEVEVLKAFLKKNPDKTLKNDVAMLKEKMSLLAIANYNLGS